MNIEEVSILAFSVFVAKGYVQHAGAAWNGEQARRYYKYKILDG